MKLHNGVGQEINEGAVLLYRDHGWHLVCDDGFTDQSADAVCRDLGFDFGKAECCSKYRRLPFDILHTVTVKCGEETGVLDCLRKETCDSEFYASVICSDQPFPTSR